KGDVSEPSDRSVSRTKKPRVKGAKGRAFQVCLFFVKKDLLGGISAFCFRMLGKCFRTTCFTLRAGLSLIRQAWSMLASVVKELFRDFVRCFNLQHHRHCHFTSLPAEGLL